jgi:hypothetical protein
MYTDSIRKVTTELQPDEHRESLVAYPTFPEHGTDDVMRTNTETDPYYCQYGHSHAPLACITGARYLMELLLQSAMGISHRPARMRHEETRTHKFYIYFGF